MNSSVSFTKKFLACSSIIYLFGTQPLVGEGWKERAQTGGVALGVGAGAAIIYLAYTAVNIRLHEPEKIREHEELMAQVEAENMRLRLDEIRLNMANIEVQNKERESLSAREAAQETKKEEPIKRFFIYQNQQQYFCEEGDDYNKKMCESLKKAAYNVSLTFE